MSIFISISIFSIINLDFFSIICDINDYIVYYVTFGVCTFYIVYDTYIMNIIQQRKTCSNPVYSINIRMRI